MELRLVKEAKGKAEIEVRGETATLTGLIADTAMADGTDAAAVHEHPFMTEPKIVVASSNPFKALEKAADNVSEQLSDFKKAFEAAAKK